jgi:UDP-2,3-diacylglucosamine pyrophosphatase LpxH
MSQPRLIVISDLHISTAPLEDFDGELQGHLCRFLAELAADPAPIELVINGDFLDFVQARPWQGAALRSRTPNNNILLCFTQKQSEDKLDSIYAEHKSVFDALGQFLTVRPTHRLVILPGNHDPDFYWPRVRDHVRDRVCGNDAGARDRLVFYLDQVYRPEAFPGVWIEHGHQHDVANSFSLPNLGPNASCWSSNLPPILTGQDGELRLLECPGTRFMLMYMNGLDERYPYVDNVKPLTRFLKIFGLSAFVSRHATFRAAVAVWGILRFLSGRAVKRPSDLLTLPEVQGHKELGPLLTDAMKHLKPGEQTALAETFQKTGLAIHEPLEMFIRHPEAQARLMDFLAVNPELAQGLEAPQSDALLSADGPPGTLSLTQSFLVDETEILKAAAHRALAEPGTQVVIMGHTHEVVKPTADLSYINTGCWTRYYRFAPNEPVRSWPLLRASSTARFPCELNYAEVVPGAAPRLVTFEPRP